LNRLFITFIALITSLSASAENGGVQTTFVPNMEMKELENKVYYNHLLSAYNTNKAYSDGLIKCAKENKYYLPSHVSADVNGCYDVLAYLESIALSGTVATFKGKAVYSGGHIGTGVGEGEFLADSKCDTNWAGSRAARYEDFKYLIQSGSVPNETRTVRVIGGIRGIDASGNTVTLSGENTASMGISGASNNCEEFTSSSTSIKERRIDMSDSSPTFTVDGCGAATVVLCVSD
jgi:hypothetical protein